MKRIILLICAFWFVVSSSYFQAQNSSISGLVKDKRGVFPSAKIILKNTSFKALCDFDGKFLIKGLYAGQYTLTINLDGYLEFEKTFSLDNSQHLDLGELVMSEIKELTEINISAYAKTSENKALFLVQNAPTVLTVVSSDIIAKLPNKNASDVVARVPGASITRNKGEGSNISLRGTPLDWTATFLNGDRLPVADEENATRSFEFEILPADMIEYVLVSKSTTPDMESDQIGGSINFLARNAVQEKTFKMNIAGGYNLLANKPTGTFNFLIGDISKNKKFSCLINGSAYARYYSADAFKIIYGSNFNHSLNRYELKKYDGTRTNISANSAIQYKFSENFKIGTHFLYSFMLDDKYQKKQSYNWFEGSGQRIRLQNIHGKLERQLFGGDIYASWNINKSLKLFCKLASYDNSFKYGKVPFNKKDSRNGYMITEFISPLMQFQDQDYVSLYGNQIDINDPSGFPGKLIGNDNPYGNGDNPNNIQPQYASIFGAQTLAASDFEFYQTYTEINQTGERDLPVIQTDLDYKMSNNLKLKFGAKVRFKSGYRTISKHEWFKDYSIPNNSNPFTLDQFDHEDYSSGREGFLAPLGSNYEGQFYSFLDPAILSSFLIDSSYLLREKEMNYLNQEYKQWVGSNYNYNEMQSGIYAMADYDIGQWSFVGGARFEYTRFNQVSDTLTNELAYDSITQTQYNVPKSIEVERNYQFLLPSLNITFRPSKNINIRFAFSESMKRPNFEQTKPGFAMIKYNDLVYIFGNPNLKATYAFNYDVAFEYFWPGKGMFSVVGFYKDVYSHIFTVTTADVDPASGIMVKKYENASNAIVYGAEVTLIRKFDFLPGFLSGFGTNSNVTISDSRMDIPGRPNKQKMTEQTPLIYNLGLVYEYKKWNARLALNYIGKNLKEVNLASLVGIGLLHKDDDFDTYINETYNLDFQVSYAWNKKGSIYLEGMNLLNAAERRYIGKEWRHLRMEYYGQRFQLGLRLDL